MEYLMTYGWAILIIAVVLGVLFQLGIFSSTNFAPRAPPGSCRVFRTAGTTNLEGVCSGQLPQYVAQFNGQSSYISIVSGTTPFTKVSVSAWISNPPALDTYRYEILNDFGIFFNIQDYSGVNKICFYLNGVNSQYLCSPTGISTKYTDVAATWNGVTETIYINGASFGTLSVSGTEGILTPAAIGLCTYCGNLNYFPGVIANIQIYNDTLDSGAIQTLYLEGIGGAPVQPQNIVGWWPLNGNTNDYSGNNNNGAPTNVVYTSSWMNGYGGH